MPNVEAIVFVSRAFENADGSHNVAGGNNQTIDYLRYTPGGHLYMLAPPTPDGVLTDLTADFEGVDVNSVDLSFDATQVVFSMQHADDNRYHIYLANLDGSGEIRQLTFGDYHDVNPIFLPGNRIAFVTNQPYTALGTRADEYNHSRVVTQMATISIDAGDADRRLCSQNLSHTATLSLMQDGTVAFSRWEHLENVNDVKLFHMNPDCTNMTAIAGQFGKGFNSVVQAQELAEPGTFVSIATSRRGTIQAGALMYIDARSNTSTNPNLYIDVQQARFTSMTPDVPTDEDSPEFGAGRYRSPRPLPGTEALLVSWANGDVNERNELAETAPNFGIYLFDPESQSRTLVYDDPNMWDLYAIPVVPREVPPVITPSVDANPDPTTPAIIGSIDVTQTSLEETVSGAQFDGTPLGEALHDAVRVRIIEGFSSEIGGGVGQFGLTMAEGAAILGETPVYEDGSWRAAVPAYLPYHLQPIDRYGLAIRNQRLWIQAMPGETRNCGGCHADRSTQVQPRRGATTLAQQVGPDMTTFLNIPDRTEFPWYGSASRENIQDVLDRNCAGCHSPGGSDPVAAGLANMTYTVNVTTMEGEMLTYQIPYLDLSSRLLEVYYENEVVSYPASYVSLLYPSAMMGDSMATGNVPPNWVEPSNARGSEMVRVMNMVSETDASDLAYGDRPLHPENVGVTVSREDRLSLIRAIDLGGQYYSRWNNGTDWSSVIDYPAAP